MIALSPACLRRRPSGLLPGCLSTPGSAPGSDMGSAPRSAPGLSPESAQGSAPGSAPGFAPGSAPDSDQREETRFQTQFLSRSGGLKAGGPRALTRLGTLLHVHDVVREFDAESLLEQDSRGVVPVDPAKQEVIGPVGQGALVPRQLRGVGRRAC